MTPSRRDQFISWIAGILFSTQDREASEGVVATLRSGGGNVGARRHDTGHLSFLCLRMKVRGLVVW